MPDEQVPPSVQPAPVSQPAPQGEQLSLPLPDLEQKYDPQTVDCEYEDGCVTPIDPSNCAWDQRTGLKLCPKHSRICSDCNQMRSVNEMQPYKADDEEETNWFCPECWEARFISCPNCDETVPRSDYLPPTSDNRYSMKDGGCTKCASACSSCDRVVADDSSETVGGYPYCEDCFSEGYFHCEHCGQVNDRDHEHFVESDSTSLCDKCYDREFGHCAECGKEFTRDEMNEVEGELYCSEDTPNQAQAQYGQYIDEFGGFSYTKKDRFLNLLYRHLPISVKELKTKYPSIANGLGDLIAFSKGQILTPAMVKEFRDGLEPEEFPVEYETWSDSQRSVDTLKRDNPVEGKPQLVMNIQASPEIINQLRVNPALYDLFTKVNELSHQSGHPFVQDQIGWCRLELDPQGAFILVDEIQSDHSNASFKLKHDKDNHEISKVRRGLMTKYELDDDSLNKLLVEYSKILKDFPNIASQAIVRFARQNKFTKLYWHTYESGKELKGNAPPKSLYDQTPKENFFAPSKDRPFGLDGQFFEKEAKRAEMLHKLARRIYFKYLGTMN